jgi:hypothetical protein
MGVLKTTWHISRSAQFGATQLSELASTELTELS